MEIKRKILQENSKEHSPKKYHKKCPTEKKGLATDFDENSKTFPKTNFSEGNKSLNLPRIIIRKVNCTGGLVHFCYSFAIA
jgi:hypothetical protein